MSSTTAPRSRRSRTSSASAPRRGGTLGPWGLGPIAEALRAKAQAEAIEVSRVGFAIGAARVALAVRAGRRSRPSRAEPGGDRVTNGAEQGPASPGALMGAPRNLKLQRNRLVRTILWDRALQRRSPREPFEVSEVVPEVVRKLRVSEGDAARLVQELLKELQRLPVGRRTFTLEGNAIAPLPEFAAAPKGPGAALAAYPFEL